MRTSACLSKTRKSLTARAVRSLGGSQCARVGPCVSQRVVMCVCLTQFFLSNVEEEDASQAAPPSVGRRPRCRSDPSVRSDFNLGDLGQGYD